MKIAPICTALALGAGLLAWAYTSHASSAAAAAATAPAAAAAPRVPAPTLSAAELERMATEMMRTSFTTRGIATMDRLFPLDFANQACAEADRTRTPLPDAVATRITQEQMRTIRLPADGRFLGDWREGELIAQSGRGLTWTDVANAASGGNCFNCHKMTREEISFGNLGPSLLNYGLLRGVTDPNSPEARPIVEYTWGVIFNPRAFFPCSKMPRAGAKGILTEEQMRHVMAFLLDPQSPVNRPEPAAAAR